MPDERWTDIGSIEELKTKSLQEVMCGTTPIALTYQDGSFAAISGACNHVGGPLGEGTLDGEYVVCPWHYWKFHRQTGQGEPGYEEDQVPAYPTKVEHGRLYVDLAAATVSAGVLLRGVSNVISSPSHSVSILDTTMCRLSGTNVWNVVTVSITS